MPLKELKGQCDKNIKCNYKKSGEIILKKSIFWIFGILQSTSLALIIFLLFRNFNLISGEPLIGRDTMVTISLSFPIFLLLIEYIIFSKD